MSDRRPSLPPAEFLSPVPKRRLTYAEKLKDVLWKRRRDELLRRSNWTCCECGEPLTAGRMDLQVHHVCYLTALDPWDYPDDFLLVCCDCHKERQAVEQAIYTFFEEDSARMVTTTAAVRLWHECALPSGCDEVNRTFSCPIQASFIDAFLG